MKMAVVMRKYSGRLFKSKGIDNFLCEKSWSSLAESVVHRKALGGRRGTWAEGGDGLSRLRTSVL